MKFKYFLFFAILTLLFTGCSKEENKNKTTNMEKSAQQKQELTQTTLKTSNNKEIKVIKTKNGFDFSGYENKIVLVNFFATWCPPCKAEIPHLVKLQSKYKKDFSIIAVLLEEDKPNSEVNSFANYNEINYPITNGLENFKMASMTGGVKSIPFMIMYDKNGNYFTHYMGAVTQEMIESDIKRAIEIK